MSTAPDELFDWLDVKGVDASRRNGDCCLSLGEHKARVLAGCLKVEGIEARGVNGEATPGMLCFSMSADPARLRAALMRALSPELLCLDVDGCLIDVRESFDAVVTRTVRAFTGQTIDRREILALRAAGGFNDDNMLALALIRERGGETTLQEVLPVFRRYYFGDDRDAGLHLQEKLLIRPELFESLQRTYSVALVTGRNREETALAMPMLRPLANTALVTVDDVARGKPDPEGILKAASMFGADRVWMLGDNKDDILAARAAGAVPIGVTSENRSALEEAGAAIVLNDINEIEVLL